MSGKTVVCDSGPLMALAKLNRLLLLRKLFGKVLIPQAVYQETVIRGMRQGYPDALAIGGIHFPLVATVCSMKG